MILRIDAAWLLDIQIAVSPPNTPIRDWGALDFLVRRHAFQRFHGEPYYEETEARAATFVHTAVMLQPFMDYNATIGLACARAYMEQSGEPVSAADKDMIQLIHDLREQHLDLAGAARVLRQWKQSPQG